MIKNKTVVNQSLTINYYLLICVSFFFLLLSSMSLKAQEDTLVKNHDEKAEEKAFDPGTFIFEHIGDAYEWHIATFGKTHVSMPLPVIVYSKEKGLNIFISSKFHHGHEAYNGFYIDEDPKSANKGKIVETLSNGQVVRPFDISLTKNVLSLLISVALLLFLFITMANTYKKNPGKAPKGLQSMLELLVIFVRDDIAKASIQKNHEKYLPYLLTVFSFIFLNNLLGLIPFFPGGANLTGNIAVTVSLAVFTFVITTFVGNKNYWTHMVNAPGVPWWLKFPIPLMPFVEIMGMFTKPFVLAVRLFANITAGHIIALVFYSLIFIFGSMNIYAGYGISVISILFTVFMMFLELLVAFIQAYVFTLLSALYFGLATEEHEHKEQHQQH